MGNADEEIEVDKWEQDMESSGYRLPKEVEWEFACRAGTATSWSPGKDESLLVDYCQMMPTKITTYGEGKLPNAWGLHNMHGNVWEWCWDLGEPGNNARRVLRGGSWFNDSSNCVSYHRITNLPTRRGNDLGFRVALSTPRKSTLSGRESSQ